MDRRRDPPRAALPAGEAGWRETGTIHGLDPGDPGIVHAEDPRREPHRGHCEDEARCHRSVLRELLLESGAKLA